MPQIKYNAATEHLDRMKQWLTPSYHAELRKGLSVKNEAVYKIPVPEVYDVRKELKVHALWLGLGLGLGLGTHS